VVHKGNFSTAEASLNGRERTAFRTALLRWFDRQQRDLPWRKDHDPYRVWVSEIMLQQTRVAAVLEHYARFLERFPDVHALAQAPIESVLTVWSGLGYYRRARMMHEAARQVANSLGGNFPTSAAEWRELPGIGRYTAAAIASICWGEPCAVVDGNVERVLGRMVDANPQTVWEIAGELLSRRRPGDFNQAMMELGAMVCLPKGPNCEVCPVARFCTWRREGRRTQSQNSAVRQKRELHYLLATRNGQVLLTQRSQTQSVMPGMWELPEMDSPRASGKPQFHVRHSIMNTDYSVGVFCEAASISVPGARWFELSRVPQMPLTGLARKILSRSGII
jgi:A/G-specific adenine glycosylase